MSHEIFDTFFDVGRVRARQGQYAPAPVRVGRSAGWGQPGDARSLSASMPEECNEI